MDINMLKFGKKKQAENILEFCVFLYTFSFYGNGTTGKKDKKKQCHGLIFVNSFKGFDKRFFVDMVCH